MDFSISSFLIALVVPAILYIYLNYKKNAKLPPGPWNLPILGYLPWLDPKAPYMSLTKLAQKFGPIYGLKLGKVYTVVISDTKLLKKIFMKDEAIGKPPLYVIETATQGKGVICTEGTLWKEQRRFVIKFLRASGAHKSSTNKKKLEEKIVQFATNFVEVNLGNQNGKVILEPSKALLCMVASVSGLLLFGTSWTPGEKAWKEYVQWMKEGESLMAVGGPLNFLPFLKILPQFGQILHFIDETRKSVYAIYQQIVDDEIQSAKSSTDIPNIIQAFFEEKTLKNNEEMYSTEQLFGLMNDLFGGSLDTTVSTTYWLLLYISLHQKIQEKLRHQLVNVLKEEPFSMSFINELPYLEAVASEVLRIRVPEPSGIPHGAIKDFQFQGYNIPKGTMIMPLLWAIHKDAKVWKNPEEFRPERFIDDEGKFYKPEEFVPFQAGKRVCVGEDLGRMVIYSFVATLVRKFRVELKDPDKADLNGVCRLILAPKPHEFIFTKL